MNNPVFTNNPAFSQNAQRTPNGYPSMPGYTPGQAPQQGYGQQQYGAPQHGQQYGTQDMTGFEQTYAGRSADAVDTERITYNDVIMTTLMIFGVVVGAAAVNWLIMDANPILTFGGAIVGLVLGLVQCFKREPSKPLILTYAVAQGLFLGGISSLFNVMYSGIVAQAVLATFATAGVALFLYSSGKVRVTPKFTRFLMIAMLGYLAFSLVNIVLMITGISPDPWGLRTGVSIFGIPLGVFMGLFVVVLAAMSLIVDFDSVTRMVNAGAPRRYAWLAAFGITVTMIWLYTEILRLLAILRSE